MDIGGTTTAAALLGDDGSLVARVALPSGHGPAAVVEVAVAAVAGLCAGAGLEAVPAVGVGVPGTVEHGRVHNAVNLGVAELDLASRLGERLGAPVHVENDVNAAAVGAHHLLAGSGGPPGSMAYLNIGTGVACGVVLDGLLWRGASGSAGEIGHVPVDPAGERCPCGQRGCLETLCSGAAIGRLWPAPDQPPPAALFAAAAAGDPTARSVRDRVLRGVADAVRLVHLSFDVEVVALGGGVSRLGVRLLTGVRAALETMAAASPFLASLGLPARVTLLDRPQDAGVLGAALLAGTPCPAGR
ncbi:ROK family protein [Georgenia satyanarayanai]|uniref:ROK family protein n=1 Tax=Georgenia satyanarayanai TaxID=860221 RepID=UPI0029CA5E0A|nr:ROK family protein [Georgenia satyanarayanai]